MWHTADGDRVLRGAEAKVFAESLLDLAHKQLVEDYCTGIPVFDSLTYPQKITILSQVAHALFREEVPMPELTAVLEGAVGAVFQTLRTLVEEEVAFPDHDKSLRDLVSRACRGLGVEEVPRPSHRGIEDWRFCVDCLHDAILWDNDYLGESIFMDLPPEQSRALKQKMDVSDGYFLAVAPDPTPKQMTATGGAGDVGCGNAGYAIREVAAMSRANSGGTTDGRSSVQQHLCQSPPRSPLPEHAPFYDLGIFSRGSLSAIGKSPHSSLQMLQLWTGKPGPVGCHCAQRSTASRGRCRSPWKAPSA